jgi:hypothetical protein
MTLHLTDEQLERFWEGRAAQAEIAHIRDCEVCRAGLSDIAAHEQKFVHIGRIYLVRDWRLFAEGGASLTLSYRRQTPSEITVK